jgi:hypothetical protein
MFGFFRSIKKWSPLSLAGSSSYFAVGTQTASGAENSTPATSVLSVTYRKPDFVPGLAEKLS